MTVFAWPPIVTVCLHDGEPVPERGHMNDRIDSVDYGTAAERLTFYELPVDVADPWLTIWCGETLIGVGGVDQKNLRRGDTLTFGPGTIALNRGMYERH